MIQTSANKLATGDTVYFPRIGKLELLRLASYFEPVGMMPGSICGYFSDGKLHKLTFDKKIKVEPATALPAAEGDQLYRFDLASSRLSVISAGAFGQGFSDVKESFKTLRVRVTALAESIALQEIQNGAIFFTEAAVYSRDAGRLQQLFKFQIPE